MTMVIKNISILVLIGALYLPHAAFAAGERAPAMSDWAQEEITEAAELGLVTDNLGGDYTLPITRLQFAGLAVNFAEKAGKVAITPLGTETFRDTSDSAVLKAAAAGITNGTGADTFSPEALITREEIATMVFRAVDYVDAGKLPESAGLSAYNDGAAVSTWAQTAVGSMVASGVMQGTSATTLTPKDNTSIEEAIALLLRAYHTVCDELATTDDNATHAYKTMEQYAEVFEAEEYETIEEIISDDLNLFSNNVGIDDINDIADVYKLYYPPTSDLVDTYDQNGTLKNSEFQYYKWYVQLKNGSKVWLAYDDETETWAIQETSYPINPAPVETTATEMVTKVLSENFDADTEIELKYLHYTKHSCQFAYIIAGEEEYLVPIYVPSYLALETGKLYTLAEVVAILKGE